MKRSRTLNTTVHHAKRGLEPTDALAKAPDERLSTSDSHSSTKTPTWLALDRNRTRKKQREKINMLLFPPNLPGIASDKNHIHENSKGMCTTMPRTLCGQYKHVSQCDKSINATLCDRNLWKTQRI